MEIFKTSPDSDWVEKWSAVDAVILKAVSLFLSPILERVISPRCFHLKGCGGAKGAGRELHAALATGKYRFVFRSDVYHYYESMNHSELLHALSQTLQKSSLANHQSPLPRPSSA